MPLVVDEARVGTAFGLMTAFQNIGLLVFPHFNGALRDTTHGYTASQVMFGAVGCFGLPFSCLLLRAEKKAGGRLEANQA